MSKDQPSRQQRRKPMGASAPARDGPKERDPLLGELLDNAGLDALYEKPTEAAELHVFLMPPATPASVSASSAACGRGEIMGGGCAR
jgi:hypothetical protein